MTTKCDFCDAPAIHTPRDPMYARSCSQHLDFAYEADDGWLQDMGKMTDEQREEFEGEYKHD